MTKKLTQIKIMKCENCLQNYCIKLSTYNTNTKRGSETRFCSMECRTNHNAKLKLSRLKTYNCSNCQKEVIKNSNKVYSDLVFCSRSCQGTLLNKLHPKRKGDGICSVCNQKTSRHRKVCLQCDTNHVNEYTQTLQELKNSHFSLAYGSYIRKHFKEANKDKHQSYCQICGYSKHIEYCHIRAIKDFPDDTQIQVVNSSDNLAILCPNCHWELDNGILKL